MNANAYAAFGDWCDLIPDGYTICPACGHNERISRTHPGGLELGRMQCHHTIIVPSDSLPKNWIRDALRGAGRCGLLARASH